MEGHERRQGFSLQDPLAKRRSPESGSSASNQLQEDSGSTSSFSGATPGIRSMGASTMLAGSSSASSRNGEIHERRTRQRITTTTHREDLVSSAPTATEQRGQNPGGFNSQQGEHQMQGSHLQGNPTPYRGQIIIIPDSALEGRIPQVDDPRIRTRLTSEVCFSFYFFWTSIFCITSLNYFVLESQPPLNSSPLITTWVKSQGQHMWFVRLPYLKFFIFYLYFFTLDLHFLAN